MDDHEATSQNPETWSRTILKNLVRTGVYASTCRSIGSAGNVLTINFGRVSK